MISVFFCVGSKVFSQVIGGNNQPFFSNQYIEGAKVVIDILQLFKKNKVERNGSQNTYSGNYCNFCLFNSDSTQKIKVTLTSKNLPIVDSMIMVIKPVNRECSLQIKCGVYNCKIVSMDEKIISWGDILINEKEILISR